MANISVLTENVIIHNASCYLRRPILPNVVSLLTTCEVAWYIIWVLSDDNFPKPWCREFISVHPMYLQGIMSCLYMKVVGSRSRSQELKKLKIPVRHKVKLWSPVTVVLWKIDMRFSMGFPAMTDQMLWPPSFTLTGSDHTGCIMITFDRLYIQS